MKERNKEMESPQLKKAYHSCFVTDVQIAGEEIRLMDSYRNPYYIKTDDKEAVASFKSWFKKNFLKGIAQNVTVFEYRLEQREECEVGSYIVKFLNIPEDSEQKMLNESSETV